MIQKYISPTIEAINALTAPQILKLETEYPLLKGYDVSVNKIERGYSCEINFKPFGGYNSSQMHRIELPQPIKLTNGENTYYIPENSIHLNQRFNDFFDYDTTINILGSIDRLCTAKEDSNFDNKYLRFIIPVIPSKGKLRDIRGWCYNTDLSTKDRTLLKVIINDVEYHFFEFQLGDDAYLVIDSTELCILLEFKKICHSILLGLGFLYGNLYLDEGFILSSTLEEFNKIADISFSIYRESIMTSYRIHTTNAYSVHDMTGKDEFEINAREVEVRKWVNDIIEIEEPIFSEICELFYNREPISRAIIVTLQGNLLPLEIKGSAYSLALEAITAVFMDEEKESRPKPITKESFKKLKAELLSVLENFLSSANQHQDAGKILKNRIDNLNNPSNSDKLQKSFELVGYTLKDYEKSALRARDKFQHGQLPVSDNSDDIVFQEVYFMTIIMHRLICILILKRIGYSGFIINYPQLHSNMTKTDLGEDVFYKL